MRYAIFSDVHGNLAALQAVLEDIREISNRTGRRIDQIWCLGDVVGYGPEPSACVQRVRGRCDVCIPGNHDWAAIERIDLADFSEFAAQSAQWTRSQLTDAEANYLFALRKTTQVGDFTLAHGSPFDPIWEYLTEEQSAAGNFSYFDTRFCVVGHSHLPIVFLQPMTDHIAPKIAAYRAALDKRQLALAMNTLGGPTRQALESGDFTASSSRHPAAYPCTRYTPAPGVFHVPPNFRAIINPGSVGQPRDGDPRASYMLYDSEDGFLFRRVPYDLGATARRIRELGLPERLAERLASGT